MATKSGPVAAHAACTLVVASAVALSGCGGSDDNTAAVATPAAVKTLSVTVYPATAVSSGATAAAQDLLTGGIGGTGIGALVPPAYADPLNPTAAAATTTPPPWRRPPRSRH